MSELEKEIEALEALTRDLTESYDRLSVNIEDKLDVDNKILKEVIKSQIPIQLAWESITRRAGVLHEHAEYLTESAFAAEVSDLMANSSKSLTITEAKESAKASKLFRRAKTLQVSVKMLRDDCKAILDTVDTRKYAINNLTNAIIAGVDGNIL